MSSGTYIQADVLCPFYITDKANPIILKCEGLQPDITISLMFVYKNTKVNFMNKYCCKQYEKCPLFDVIYKKYEDEINMKYSSENKTVKAAGTAQSIGLTVEKRRG